MCVSVRYVVGVGIVESRRSLNVEVVRVREVVNELQRVAEESQVLVQIRPVHLLERTKNRWDK